jgi:hypothetical protein
MQTYRCYSQWVGKQRNNLSFLAGKRLAVREVIVPVKVKKENL